MLAAIPGCTPPDTGAGGSAPGATATSHPDELPVLLLDGSEPDPEALARTFLGDDITPGEPLAPDDTRLIFKSGSEAVWIDHGELHYLREELREPVSVSVDEATQIATDFLEDTIGVSDDAVLREMPGALMSSELGSDEPGTPFLYTIQWERVIDGIPVAGAQWIRVNVGAKGEIDSLHRRWHKVTGEGEMVHIKEAADVVEPGEVGGGLVTQMPVPVTAEQIAAARLVYYVPFTDGDDRQMTPAWEVIAEDGHVDFYFHAGTGELLGG